MILTADPSLDPERASVHWLRVAPDTPLRIPDDARWVEVFERITTVLGPWVHMEGPLPPSRDALPPHRTASTDPALFRAMLRRCAAASPDPLLRDGADALWERWTPTVAERSRFLVLGDPPWGVVAPRVLEPSVGGLLFVGVSPEHRGRGLGHRAARAGWACLRRVGCSRLRDEVIATNLPMMRVFEQAGLSAIRTYRLALPPSPAPRPL